MAAEQSEQVVSEEPDKLSGAPEEEHEEARGPDLMRLGVAALGVVYGDIGTSPLYALRKCFARNDGIDPTAANVLGVLSLIFWSLIIVVTLKYLLYVMRADNEGEGGILALMAIVATSRRERHYGRGALVVLGVFGAALLYSDGMITPAISVLSAVEGLEVATDALRPFVIPIALTFLVLLFLFQRKGTEKVGGAFGPIMLVWFLTIAVLGAVSVFSRPDVLAGLNPIHACTFFWHNGWAGFVTLGAVFLVVTGSEALYADLGHFGRAPIRLPWFAVVLPALTLNYFGQGALILARPAAAAHPFYLLAPGWATYPLVALAVAATIIASQAVISASFSLTRQAVLLGRLPRLRVTFTSGERAGQIYIPIVNWILMAACIGLVLGFQQSTELAGAYGLAVSLTLVITTLLAYVVARQRWGWGLLPAIAVTVGLLIVDLAFFGANLTKIPQGGWFPLTVACVIYVMMYTWTRGCAAVEDRIRDGTQPIDAFLKSIEKDPPVRVPGVAVFLTKHQEGTPAILMHCLKHNQVLHEHVLLLSIAMEEVARVRAGERLEVEDLSNGIMRVVLHFGFRESPNVPAALSRLNELDIEPDKVTYYVGRQTLITKPQKKRRLRRWWLRLFALMSRNAAEPTTFFRLPPSQVFEAGIRVEI